MLPQSFWTSFYTWPKTLVLNIANIIQVFSAIIIYCPSNRSWGSRCSPKFSLGWCLLHNTCPESVRPGTLKVTKMLWFSNLASWLATLFRVEDSFVMGAVDHKKNIHTLSQWNYIMGIEQLRNKYQRQQHSTRYSNLQGTITTDLVFEEVSFRHPKN